MTNLRDLLSRLATEDWSSHRYNGLSDEEIAELTRRDIQTYRGKVRDLIFDGAEILMLHSDRLSAFDQHVALVPYKGTILTDIAEYWLQKTNSLVANHYLGRPEPQVLKVAKTEPIRAEIIVRGYMAGSMQRAYAKGERRFCGIDLPDGLQPYGKLPQPIITPTTKSEHDENTTAEALVENGIMTTEEWDDIAKKSMALFEHGSKLYREKGWILVDTKYEFGRSKNGQIIAIDEIHTPDSSRLWRLASYDQRLTEGAAPDMFDKETVRRYLMEHGKDATVPGNVLVQLAENYLEVAESLRGHPLDAPRSMVEAKALYRQ